MQIDDSPKFKLEKIIIFDFCGVDGAINPVTLTLKDKIVITKDTISIAYYQRPDKSFVIERKNVIWWAKSTESRRVPLTTVSDGPDSPSTPTRS